MGTIETWSAEEWLAQRHRPMSPFRRVVLFIVVFVSLQTLWAMADGSAIERLVIDKATVEAAAIGIRLLTPEMPVVADGSRLTALGGGINILKGCEGTEVMFLLVAAFSVAGLPWRRSVSGLALGAVVVYLLNQVRILALFYAYRLDRALFNHLHGTVAPLIMVLAVGLYYFAWQHWSVASAPKADAVAPV